MIAASVGVLLAVLGSGPEPVEPVVRWEAPAGCGTARELRERVTRQLGALEAGIEIIGRVRRAEGLHVLELELVVDGERQRRSFSAVECHTLLDAAAIVSSAALGPSGTGSVEAVELPGSAAAAETSAGGGSSVGPGPASVPEPTSVPVPPARPAPAVSPAPVVAPGRSAAAAPSAVRTPSTVTPADDLASEASREPAGGSTTATPRPLRPGRWLVSTRAGIGWDGTLAAPVGSLGLGRAWARWRVQALVDVFGGRAHGPRGALDLRVVTVTPRACGVIRPRPRIELSPCAGVTVGPAVGRGRDVPNPRTAVVPWIAAQLDFGVWVVPRRWLALGLELSNYARLGRSQFVLSDQRRVYRAGTAGSRAFLTVELRFSATDRAGAGH